MEIEVVIMIVVSHYERAVSLLLQLAELVNEYIANSMNADAKSLCVCVIQFIPLQP